MNYPFWDIDIGYGYIMAAIAVIHVFVSHFAIGGGLYLVITERRARANNDSLMLDYLQKMSKFFVLVSVVFGALTGVGIWFIIGLLNPAGTEALIHHYVWGWAIEWTFFAIEIAAALVYYYGWKRMSAKDHEMIGWIYFVSAWLSLVVINGIITFMLTPGEWLVTGNFWDGFFNPTYWSSVVLRTGICIMLAGLYAQLVASRVKETDFRGSIVRYNAVWTLAGLGITLPSFIWYFNQIPSVVTETAIEMNQMPISAMDQSYWYAAGVAIIAVLFGLIIPKRHYMAVALAGMLFGLGWFGAYEWFRESLRKPYVIYEYMYANGIELDKEEIYRQDGYLAHIEFRTGDDGADLFRRACRTCHTVDGYRPLKPGLDGTDPEFIAGVIRGAHEMYGNMPPFMGTEKEIIILADYIYEQTDQRSLKEIYKLSGVDFGKKVYEIRCGKCHQFNGYNDKAESLLDLEDEDYHDLLDMAGDFADEMPAFTGDNDEREALILYWKSLSEGGIQ